MEELLLETSPEGSAQKNKTISILVSSETETECREILSILSSQNDFHVAGVVKDLAGIIIKSERCKPDILILDMQMPGMDNYKLTQMIRRRSPATIIIMLCDKNHSNYAELANKAGISGVLLTKEDINILVEVIRTIIHGGFYFSTPIAENIIGSAVLKNIFPQQINIPLHLTYTPAERDIITDIAKGFSDEQIARHLNYSKGTIRNYITAIKRKTNFKNRAQIAVFSLIYRLISFDQLMQ